MPFSSKKLEREMGKILAVIKREYLQVVRTKGFIIGTLLGPLLMALIIVIPILSSLIAVPEQETIGVIDSTQDIYEELDKKLDYKMKDGRRRYLLKEFEAQARTDDLRDALRQKVLDKELSAFLFIPEDIASGGKAEYVSEHVSDFSEIRSIQEALNGVVIAKRLKREGLEPQKIAQYIERVGLKTIKLTKKGEEEEDTGGTFLISYLLVFILYMTLFFYGAIIMRSVIEEKNSRVVEVILSSLRPFQLMIGKIFGVAAVGFTQYTIWALFGLAASRYSKPLISSFVPAAEFSLPSIPAYIFVYFVIFFILGYFLYGTIYAAVGSMVNSEKEASQLLMPVSLSLVVPMLMMAFILRSPSSSFSVILSLIPFFAPVLMLMRICILLPPFLQIAGSIVLLSLTILFMIWLTSKIYRVGILMYGKRPNIKEVVKWMRYK
jgi:ABC-2 type transport system permease protein